MYSEGVGIGKRGSRDAAVVGRGVFSARGTGVEEWILVMHGAAGADKVYHDL